MQATDFVLARGTVVFNLIRSTVAWQCNPIAQPTFSGPIIGFDDGCGEAAVL